MVKLHSYYYFLFDFSHVNWKKLRNQWKILIWVQIACAPRSAILNRRTNFGFDWNNIKVSTMIWYLDYKMIIETLMKSSLTFFLLFIYQNFLFVSTWNIYFDQKFKSKCKNLNSWFNLLHLQSESFWMATMWNLVG